MGLVNVITWTALVVLLAGCTSLKTNQAADTKVNTPGNATLKVMTDRNAYSVQPLLARFEQATGLKTELVIQEKDLLKKMQDPSISWDIVVAKDAEQLVIAKEKGLLSAFSSEKINSVVPSQFRDRENFYFIDGYQVRSISYNKKRVNPSQLSSYEDLASPKWKGKLCIRSGTHFYNMALFSQMYAKLGAEKTKKIIAGIRSNLVQPPNGGDRDQAKFMHEGKCDVTLINTYYFPTMASNSEQKPWVDAAGIFIPNEAKGGALITRSGIALGKGRAEVKTAVDLLEFLASEESQEFSASYSHQFPVSKNVKVPETLIDLASRQPGSKNGTLSINEVPLLEQFKARESVAKILEEVKFDK